MGSAIDSIESFFNQFPEARKQGRHATNEELNQLPNLVQDRLPGFWRKALIEFPLCGLEIGVPSNFGQDKLKSLPQENLPLMSIKFLSPTEIADQSMNFFPGHLLIEKSLFSQKTYLCIAIDIESTQEGIFISTENENLTPLLVLHDFGTTKKQLIKNAEPIASSLGNLFEEAHLKNRNRIISENNLQLAKNQLAIILQTLKLSALSTPDRIPEAHSMSERNILSELTNNTLDQILTEEFGGFLENLANGIPELSIPEKKMLWGQIHEIYTMCDLHKGDLYFIEAHSLI